MSRRHAHGRRLVFVLTAVMAATLAPEAGPVEARDDDIVAIDADHLPEQDGKRNQFDPVRKVTPADITIGTAGGGATPDLGRERVDPPADVKPQQATDIANLRTEFSSVTANTDGTFTATVTGERQNYLDAKGAWQPIDTTLVADKTDGFTYRTKANDRVVRIDTSPTDGVIAVLEAGKHRVALVDPAAADGVLDATTDTVAFGTGDALLLSPTPEGIEFSFRLDSRISARTHDLRLETDGLTAAVGKDGQTIELRDETGAIALLVTAPRTIDAVGAVPDPEQTTVRLVDETTIDPGPIPSPTVAPTTEPSATVSPTAIPSPSEQPSMSATPGPSRPQTPVPGDAGEATAEPSAGDSDAAVGTFEAPAGATATGTTPPTVDASGSTSPAPSTPPPDPTPTPAPSPTPTLVAASPTPEPVSTPAPTPTAQSPPTDGAITLRYAIADAWLDDPTRVYPVLLDPTVIQGTGSGAYDCDVVGNADAWDDWIGQANNPLCSSYMAIGTDDDATAFAIQRGLFWFKGVSLGSGSYADDGQQITTATFSLYKDEGSARAIQSTLITGTGWSSPADWSDQQGQGGDDSIKYLCANGTSKDCDAGAALSATSAIPLAGDAIGAAKLVVKYGDDAIAVAGFVARHGDEGVAAAGAMFRRGDEFVEGGMRMLDDAPVGSFCSFSAATLVRTADGQVPIADLEPGDEVLARDEVSGTTDTYPITAIWSHPDAVTGTVEIDGEPIAVTPEHPFRTTERGWVTADDLQPGDHVVSLTGSAGIVGAISWNRGPDTMWNLTVATAHTYSVGVGRWLVHNACGPDLPAELTKGRNADPGVSVYVGRREGTEVYAGITNNLRRRQGEHSGRFDISAISSSAMTRGQARSVEQAMIVRARSAGLKYENQINSISPTRSYYGQAVEWGESWLKANGR